ncbi:hypothetical protein ABIA13_000333 [Sinorhizobium fredii]
MTMAAGKRGALLLAAGEIERRAVEIRCQLQEFCGLADFAVDRGVVGPLDTHRRGDVVVDRHRRIVDELLIDHRNGTPLHGQAGDVGAVEMERTGGWLVEAGHQPHQRRLAGECRAEQHVQRPPLQHKVGRVDMRLPAHDLGYVLHFKH